LGDIDLEGREVAIWHGKLDVNCELGMAEKVVLLLERAKTRFLDEEGHNLVAPQSEAILKSFACSDLESMRGSLTTVKPILIGRSSDNCHAYEFVQRCKKQDSIF
jgi:hypothetical protein